jgi:hypothetical protein
METVVRRHVFTALLALIIGALYGCGTPGSSVLVENKSGLDLVVLIEIGDARDIRSVPYPDAALAYASSAARPATVKLKFLDASSCRVVGEVARIPAGPHIVTGINAVGDVFAVASENFDWADDYVMASPTEACAS